MVVLGYYSNTLVITALNYNGEAIMFNCLFNNIQFIKNKKEALKQLNKEV